MITIIQRAKFALMYQRVPAIVCDNDDEDYVVRENQECGHTHPAILEIDGLIRLNSDTPKDAAHAARINAALDRLHQALPPIIP